MSLFEIVQQQHTPVVAHTSTRHAYTVHTHTRRFKSLFYRPNKPKKKCNNENNAQTPLHSPLPRILT